MLLSQRDKMAHNTPKTAYFGNVFGKVWQRPKFQVNPLSLNRRVLTVAKQIQVRFSCSGL